MTADEMCCASCGIAAIDDIKLKKCDGGCDLVKYCSDECQEKHREQHEGACKKSSRNRIVKDKIASNRVAVRNKSLLTLALFSNRLLLRDKVLFTLPDSSNYGDCPICCLPLSLDPEKSTLMTCCSKLLCNGCIYANAMREIREGLKQRCVFCREPLINSAEEGDKNVMERVKKNDPVAMRQWGKMHLEREEGIRHLEVDYGIAFEYLTKAAELGEADAHFSLSVMYLDGEGVEKDIEKAVYHAEEAAIAGHPGARYNLGYIEYKSGRFDRAKKHFIVAANLGYEMSLKGLRQLYKEGYASEEDYDAARCAYQAAVEATKSPEREEGEAYYEAREAAQHSESNTTLSCIVM